MKRSLFSTIIFTLFCVNHKTVAQHGFIPPASDTLIAEIFQADSLLFDAVFNSCDADKLSQYVTEDLEFYHDKWGQIADTGEAFVEAIRQGCERQASGIDNQAKREIIRETVEIYPLNNFGAIQSGTHRFYQLKEGKYVLTESGKFTHLWKKEGDKWLISRILSYDHIEAK